ncbi:MAG: hypothetical protein IPM78_10235 [Moraxellaceae bacterium]|nr:hypothetical protein [Moraxellaceae bacterium]
MKTAILAFCLIATLTLVGCASKPQTFGDQLSDGHKHVDSSKQQMLNSEADYQKMRQTPVLTPTY